MPDLSGQHFPTRIGEYRLLERLGAGGMGVVYLAEHVGTGARYALKTLTLWTDRLREQAGDDFPEKVTAFRPEMAAHGRYGKACPTCGDPIQRIVYASNETNYCATCQTGGKLLADRALSQLLKKDWPRSLEELEARKRQ